MFSLQPAPAATVQRTPETRHSSISQVKKLLATSRVSFIPWLPECSIHRQPKCFSSHFLSLSCSTQMLATECRRLCTWRRRRLEFGASKSIRGIPFEKIFCSTFHSSFSTAGLVDCTLVHCLSSSCPRARASACTCAFMHGARDDPETSTRSRLLPVCTCGRGRAQCFIGCLRSRRMDVKDKACLLTQ